MNREGLGPQAPMRAHICWLPFAMGYPFRGWFKATPKGKPFFFSGVSLCDTYPSLFGEGFPIGLICFVGLFASSDQVGAAGAGQGAV